MSDAGFEQLLADGRLRACWSRCARDGRPQLSNVTHVYEPETELLRVSITDPTGPRPRTCAAIRGRATT